LKRTSSASSSLNSGGNKETEKSTKNHLRNTFPYRNEVGLNAASYASYISIKIDMKSLALPHKVHPIDGDQSIVKRLHTIVIVTFLSIIYKGAHQYLTPYTCKGKGGFTFLT